MNPLVPRGKASAAFDVSRDLTLTLGGSYTVVVNGKPTQVCKDVKRTETGRNITDSPVTSQTPERPSRVVTAPGLTAVRET